MIETPVLIVGGGPIGLALAADLGRRGVPTLLVEKSDNTIGPAKMLEVSVRTMELCRTLGVVDEVRNWGFPFDYPFDNAFVTDMQGYEIGRLSAPSLGEQRSSEFSPERGMMCPQTWFDPILQKHARSFPHVTIRHRVKLERFVQDEDGVTATLTDQTNGAAEHVRAKYLIGCDGFVSTVRDALGIEVRGEHHIDWSMNVYLRIPDFFSYHDKKPAIRYVYIGPEGTWSFITLVDGKDLWRLQFVGVDENKLQSLDIAALVRRAMGREVHYTIEDKTLWVRKRTVADRFSAGRVFLAGDSAHAHPPNGGLGMNTGIQDAFDLAWKLAATLQAGAARRCSIATTWSGGPLACAPTMFHCKTIADCSAPSRAPAFWRRRPRATPPGARSASGWSRKTGRLGSRSACTSATSTTPRRLSFRTAVRNPRTIPSATGRPRFQAAGRLTSGFSLGARRSICSAMGSRSLISPASRRRLSKPRPRNAAYRLRCTASSIPELKRSTTDRSCWCGPTAMWPGAATAWRMPRPSSTSGAVRARALPHFPKAVRRSTACRDHRRTRRRRPRR